MAILPLYDRKDQYQHHQVQLNVAYRNVNGEATGTTVWANSEKEGISNLLEYGMILKGDGVNPDRWIPPNCLLHVELMDTVNPVQAKAAADKYNEECPRC